MPKKIGLALSGGGARGFAHVGALKVLARHDIKFDLIAGTSAGSIIGGALAAGMSIAEIEAMAARTRFSNTIRPSFSPSGLLSNAPLGSFLDRELPKKRFEDLQTPFAAVVYDLTAGAETVFTDTGDLIFAIRASCAVPGIFCPMTDDEGHILVDGGVSSPFPAAALKAMGADVIIGIDVLSCGGTYSARPWSALSIAIRSSLSLIRSASAAQHHIADLVIEPAIAHLRPDQIGKRDEFITLGQLAAEARIDEVIELLNQK